MENCRDWPPGQSVAIHLIGGKRTVRDAGPYNADQSDCIYTLNGYWWENGWSFLMFPGKIVTNPGSTGNDWFRLVDICICVVEKTVETVNNILYMQIYQKKLTNYTAGSIIISDSSKKLG